MSETVEPAQAPQDVSAADTDVEDSTKTPTEIDWKQKSREWEKKAKANLEAANRLSALEESQKTAEQRAAERLADVEKRAAEAETRLLRFDIAKETGIPEWADDLTGHTEDEIRASAERISKRLTQLTSPKAPKPDPNQGRQTAPGASTADQFAAAVSGLL